MRLYEYFVCGNNLVFPFYGIYLFLGVVCSDVEYKSRIY